MDYIGDWDKRKERYDAFWEGELIDRICMSIRAPRGKTAAFGPDASSYGEMYWADGEWLLKNSIASFENTYFGGDSYPDVSLGLATSGHACYMKNARYKHATGTVWFDQSVFDPEERVRFDENSHMYRKTMELADYFISESRGRFIVGNTDNCGNLDALAHLRGNEDTLIDLAENEEVVRENLKEIQKAWETGYAMVYAKVAENNGGGTSIPWMQLWGRGKLSQLQSDISVMISPDMFSAYVMPELQEQAAYLDKSIYHLDGYQQIRHLDKILSIESLSGIQWTPVAGQPSPVEFIPVLQRIQKAGKRLMLFLEPNEVEPIMNALSSRGLFINVWAEDVMQAKAVEKLAAGFTNG